MNFNKGISTLAGVIIIVAVAVVFIGSVFTYKYITTPKEVNQEEANNTQLTDQTAGWKTYTNTQYGYQVSYPAEAGIEEAAGYAMSYKNINPEACVKISYKEGYVYIATPDNQEVCGGVTGLGIGDTEFQDTAKIGDESYNMSGWKLLGTGEYLSTILSNGTKITYGVWLQNGEKIDGDEYQNIQDVIKMILSTFKFITPIDETAGWKTYTNNEYGFEIKYPENYFQNIDTKQKVNELLRSKNYDPVNDIYLANIRISYSKLEINSWMNEEIKYSNNFAGPHSFTAEDIVEIQCHGGFIVAQNR